MTGKEKCAVLKEVRRKEAERLGIDLHQRECTYEGECRGTCPKCMAEEMQLNAELLKRKALVAGGAVGVAVSMSACSFNFPGVGFGDTLEGETSLPPGYEDPLGGDVEYDPNDYDPDNYEGGLVDPYIDDMLEGVATPDPDYVLEGDVAIVTDDGNKCSIDEFKEAFSEAKHIDEMLDKMFAIESDH